MDRPMLAAIAFSRLIPSAVCRICILSFGRRTPNDACKLATACDRPPALRSNRDCQLRLWRGGLYRFCD